MPAQRFEVDLTRAGRHEIVRKGQVFNSLWIDSIPDGVTITLDVGESRNLPVGEGSFTLGDSPMSDRENGVWIVNDVAVAGAQVVGGVSFQGGAGYV